MNTSARRSFRSCVEEGAGPCISDPNSGTVCSFTSTSCQTRGQTCINFSGRMMLAEWTVVSIEISRPDQETQRVAKVVITPTAMARK